MVILNFLEALLEVKEIRVFLAFLVRLLSA